MSTTIQIFDNSVELPKFVLTSEDVSGYVPELSLDKYKDEVQLELDTKLDDSVSLIVTEEEDKYVNPNDFSSFKEKNTSEFLTKANTLINNINDNIIYIKDADNKHMLDFTLYGKSNISGTPSVLNHASITGVGSTGKTNIRFMNKNLFSYERFKQMGNSCSNNGTITYDDANKSITVTATSKQDAYSTHSVNTFKDFIPCKPNTTYTMSWKSSGTHSNIYVTAFLFGFESNTSGTHISFSNATPDTQFVTYTTPSTAKYLSYRFGAYGIGDVVTYSDIQIEESSVPTNYVEHQEQNLELPLIDPLYSIENLSDRLCIQNGLLGVLRNTFKLTYINDGSTTILTQTGDSYGDYKYRVKLSNSLNNACKYTDNKRKRIISDAFPLSSDATQTINSAGVCFLHNDGVYCYPEMTYEDFVLAFSNNPITFIAPLPTPVFEPFNNYYQEKFNEIIMYFGDNNITNSDSATIDIYYNADTKLYIDNKFNKLQSVITAMS